MIQKVKLKKTTMKEWADELGLNYDILSIKCELIGAIFDHCHKHKISQRQLAKKVPGLTQDRVSKIFNGQFSHMTIDKLVEILSVLGYSIEFKAKKSAA